MSFVGGIPGRGGGRQQGLGKWPTPLGAALANRIGKSYKSCSFRVIPITLAYLKGNSLASGIVSEDTP
jgi:hypothetical protein